MFRMTRLPPVSKPVIRHAQKYESEMKLTGGGGEGDAGKQFQQWTINRGHRDPIRTIIYRMQMAAADTAKLFDAIPSSPPPPFVLAICAPVNNYLKNT